MWLLSNLSWNIVCKNLFQIRRYCTNLNISQRIGFSGSQEDVPEMMSRWRHANAVWAFSLSSFPSLQDEYEQFDNFPTGGVKKQAKTDYRNFNWSHLTNDSKMLMMEN